MKKSKFDVLKLTSITSEFFLNSNIDPISYPKLSKSLENIWSKISEKYFGFNSYNKALLVFTWYRRNTDNFSRIVQYKMKNFIKIPDSCFQRCGEHLKSILIQFDVEDFNEFKISGTKRKKFLVDFEEALNSRLQEKGFKCYFR
ncbi:hypothetical protein BpHYR1_048715, partial [Brachionus plicatilis]